MLLSNIFDHRQHFLPVLLQCMILVLKFSPEIVLSNFREFGKDKNEIFFIFSILQGTLSFRLIMVTLTTSLLIFCMVSILTTKKGIIGLEVISHLFFPIQTYLTVLSINNEQLSKGQIAYFGMTFVISLIVIICKYWFFDFRTDSALITKPCNKSYQILTQVIMIFSGVASFLLNQNSTTVILLLLMALLLIKSYVVFYCINFQRPIIQYATYICEPLSWISLLTVFLYTVHDMDISLVLWGYLCFIILHIFVENSIVRFLMQKKYSNFLRNFLDQSKRKNKQKAQEHEQNLIIYLSLIKICLKLRNKNIQKQYFLNFSKHFFHEFCASITQLQQIDERKTFLEKHHNSLSWNGSNILRYQIQAHILKNKQFTFQHQHQYAQKYWSIIKQLKQLQDDNYNNLCRYVCYSLPHISNAFQARAIYIYYLSHQEYSEKHNISKSLNHYSFIEKLHNEIDYNFVVEKTKNKKIQQILLKQNYSNQEQKRMVGLNSNLDNYCLKTQMAYGSSYFEDYYKQTVYEQTLQNLFHNFIQIEKQLIIITGSSHSTMKSLVQNLHKVNKIKKDIFAIVNSSPQVESKQFVLQQYILSKYILKLPLLARQKLKLFQWQKDEKNIKNNIFPKSFKASAKSLQWKQSSNNQAIMMISAVKSKGSIIYGSNTFKQIMEIKSGLKLITDQKHEMLHLDHLLLPCWVDQHDQVMRNLLIYEKPHHHLGNKYHIKSTVSKNIYEVQFTMHFITCKTDDLVIAMDMRYLKLDYLLIKKNNQKVFLQNPPENVRKRRVGTIFGQRNPLQKKFLNFDEPEFGFKKNRKKYQEVIFGQKYEIVAEHRREREDSIIDAATAVSNEEIELHHIESSIWSFQNDKDDKRKSMQKKLHHYRKNHFLLPQNYYTLISVKIISVFIIIILGSSLVNILAKQSKIHAEFYQFKHKVQSQYFLTDLKSFNSFLMLFVPLKPNLVFHSDQTVAEFESVWYRVFTQELTNLKQRSQDLSKNLHDSKMAIEMNYLTLNQSFNTFLYQQQKYEVQYYSVLKGLQFNQNFDQSTIVFPNPQKILNLAQGYRLNKIYQKNLNLFAEYLQPKSVADSMIKTGDKIVQQQRVKIQLFFLLILVVPILGISIFVVLYMRYLNILYDFVSSLFDLPEKSIKNLQTELEEFRNFITESKDSSDPNPYRTIQTCHSIGSRKRTMFLRKIQKTRKSKQIEPLSPIQSDWKIILLLFVFIVSFVLIMYGGYTQANEQISLLNRYMDGTKQLVQLSAKSINVFTLLMDSIFFIDKPLSKKLPLFISQIKQVNLLTAMEKLQSNPVDLKKSLFLSWYDTNYLKINFFDDQQKGRTLMETFKKSTQLYEIMYYKLSNRYQDSFHIDSKLIVQMYKQLSHSTQMIRQLFIKAQQNYFDAVPDVNLYLMFSVLCSILFTIVILLWTYERLFKRTKILFEETMSFSTIKDLLFVPTLAFHMHEAERQTSYKDIF